MTAKKKADLAVQVGLMLDDVERWVALMREDPDKVPATILLTRLRTLRTIGKAMLLGLDAELRWRTATTPDRSSQTPLRTKLH